MDSFLELASPLVVFGHLKVVVAQVDPVVTVAEIERLLVPPIGLEHLIQ